MRIMLAQESAETGAATAAALHRLGHTVDWERDGSEAEAMLQAQHYALVLLDVALPGTDGLTILKALRGRRSATPVLMLTARSDIEERVALLDQGADDCLVKPCDLREVEARVRALLRRHSGSAVNLIEVGGLTLDPASRVALLHGRPLELTRRELTILEILAARPGRVFGKEELMDQLFGFKDEPSENAVEQYIGRVRRKIAGASARIRTLRGLGYQLLVP
jgi:two-component system response regulator TctD